MVLLEAPNPPHYIVELSQFDGRLKDIFRIIGFAPSSGLSEEQEDALIGIAYSRGITRYEPEPTEDQALNSLSKHPEVLEQFRHAFPYLKW